MLLSLVVIVILAFAIRSTLKEYKVSREQQKREEEYKEYLRQQEISRITEGAIYIEISNEPLWEKEIWQVTEIHTNKNGRKRIILQNCLSTYPRTIGVSENELISQYSQDNYIFEYNFSYGNRLLESYENIIDKLSERKASVERMIEESKLRKTNNFKDKSGDDIPEEDYYDYIDYIVYSGEQKYKEQD